MRFITRTLPWVVILVVIAFFIGLKQSSNRLVRTTTSPADKEVASKLEASPSAATTKSDALEANSETSVDQPEAVIIIEESTTVEEEPVGEKSGDTDEQPAEDSEKSKAGQPSPTDGDPIDLKQFEGTAETTAANQTPEVLKTDTNSEDATDSSSDSSKSEEKESSDVDVTSLIGSPIFLSMNPPILNQPITKGNSGSQQSSDSDWEWSDAIKGVQSEVSDDTTESTPDAKSQGEMPTMYGPAKEDVNVVDEEVEATVEDTSADADANEADAETDKAGGDACEVEEQDGASEEDAEESPSQESTQRKPLSPELQKLRDGVRQTIQAYAKPILNTRDNTVAQLLDVCEAFGCDAEVMYVDQKRKINAFANLCYNYPCAGYKPLKISNGQIEPRLGYGFQAVPGQMLAVMALARVPEDYTVQFNEQISGTVADLVQREKETCREGEDLSFKLIGIMRYTPSGETWKSEDGQVWSNERLLTEVLKQPTKIDSVAGTNRLLAISYAVDRRMRRDEPIDGPYAKAAAYVTDFQDYALKMINNDGTWHPQFFLSKGTGSPDQGRLQSTGHILRWLVFSLPEERLRDPRIVKSVYQLQRSLGGNAQYSLASSSPQTIDSRLTAVHALVLYNNRLFRPYDAVEETEVVETAQSEKGSVK